MTRKHVFLLTPSCAGSFLPALVFLLPEELPEIIVVVQVCW